LIGGRWGHQMVLSNSNTSLIVFAGDSIDKLGNQGLINDIWECDLSTFKWRFIFGNQTANTNSTYTSPYGIIGSRNYFTKIIHPNGSLFVFGGFGYDAFGNESRHQIRRL
jgi:hypothetical protein